MINPADLTPLPPGTPGWGMFDTKEKNWIGTTEAPLVYGTEEVAQLAARLTDARLNQPAGRIRATWYEVVADTKVEDIKPKFSAEEAFERLESGRTL